MQVSTFIAQFDEIEGAVDAIPSSEDWEAVCNLVDELRVGCVTAIMASEIIVEDPASEDGPSMFVTFEVDGEACELLLDGTLEIDNDVANLVIKVDGEVVCPDGPITFTAV